MFVPQSVLKINRFVSKVTFTATSTCHEWQPFHADHQGHKFSYSYRVPCDLCYDTTFM